MKRWIHFLGAINLVTLLLHAAFSYVEAPVATYSVRPQGQIVFYAHVGQWIAERSIRTEAFLVQHGARFLLSVEAENRLPSAPGPAGLDVDAIRQAEREREERISLMFSGEGFTRSPRAFAMLYSVPLLISTAIALAVLGLIARRKETVEESIAITLRRWSYAFALAMICAAPVLVADFWLSVAWGRTLWWGGNPYYSVPIQAFTDLPFDPPILKMTYGPLWALVSWAMARLTLGSVLWTAVVFKALLALGWVLLIWVVHRLVSDRSASEQCLAVVMTGWLPLAVVQTVGDGHNDVFMVAFMLLWLLALERARPALGTVALALAFVVKYASAPLFLLDLLHNRANEVSHPGGRLIDYVRQYAPRAMLAGAVIVLVFAPVFRSFSFFTQTVSVHAGHFYLPADAVKAIGELLHLRLLPLELAVQAIFPLVTVVMLWRYWVSPGRDTFRLAVAGMMLSVLFDAAGHVWPWYVLWLLAFAAIVPTSSIARWTMGVAITAPFPLLVWTVNPKDAALIKYQLPSLLAYGFALIWLLWLGSWFQPSSSEAMNSVEAQV